MLVLTADVREESSGVPFLLETFGVRVERRRLRFGDYVCGPETVVERKTALDLHKTLSAGRLWPQLGRLRDAGRSPYLIVEGRRLFQGPINADGIRGACLAASDLRNRRSPHGGRLRHGAMDLSLDNEATRGRDERPTRLRSTAKAATAHCAC
jgi:hypothetical protein